MDIAIDFEKGDGLVPAVVQDARSGAVLMLGYMDADAVLVTRKSGRVTFFSRSRGRLWTKGESSGHFLEFVDMEVDCDNDALLVRAHPHGPTCHTGAVTCWGDPPVNDGITFLRQLQDVIAERGDASPRESYTRRLLDKGPAGAGQKVGEEAVETVIAALAEDDDHLVGEAADLVYHLMVLLRSRNLTLNDVGECLRSRHTPT